MEMRKGIAERPRVPQEKKSLLNARAPLQTKLYAVV